MAISGSMQALQPQGLLDRAACDKGQMASGGEHAPSGQQLATTLGAAPSHRCQVRRYSMRSASINTWHAGASRQSCPAHTAEALPAICP